MLPYLVILNKKDTSILKYKKLFRDIEGEGEREGLDIIGDKRKYEDPLVEKTKVFTHSCTWLIES